MNKLFEMLENKYIPIFKRNWDRNLFLIIVLIWKNIDVEPNLAMYKYK